MVGSNAESGVGFCAARGVEDEGGWKTFVGRELVRSCADDGDDVIGVVVDGFCGMEASFVISDSCVVVVMASDDGDNLSVTVKYWSISCFACCKDLVVGIRSSFNKTFPSLNPN